MRGAVLCGADSAENSILFCIPLLAAGWGPIVARVAAALGEPIAFAQCDLARSIEEPINSALQDQARDVPTTRTRTLTETPTLTLTLTLLTRVCVGAFGDRVGAPGLV